MQTQVCWLDLQSALCGYYGLGLSVNSEKLKGI